jgi:uncharacterized protein (DUF362 family)
MNTLVSVLSRPEVDYPVADDFYSPSVRYPEYPFDHLAARTNPVYEMVRELFAQAGLDEARVGTAAWNPLGAWVPPGSRVFVLCNFVYHRRPHDAVTDLWAKCAHGSVLRALVDYLLLAAGPEAEVRFGNSALQSCDWQRVLHDTGADRVAEFYRRHGRRVEPTDLRLHVAQRSLLGRVTSVERRGSEDGVELDLGSQSLLAQLPGSPRFRISDYDPRRIEAFHAAGTHRYVIHRRILESDVVFSLPKLKTHEKVGITCGLKGFVGSVGHKDCLAHHRFGNPAVGGDEYPDRFAFVRPLSALHDWINRRPAAAPLQGGFEILERTAQRLLRRCGVTRGGAWAGNDTAWRMTLDLARILYFADAGGTLHDEPQRRHLTLIDGIVAGEGDGPLTPAAVRAGCLLLGNDVAWGDRVACQLMGFDPQAIPLLREAARALRGSPVARPRIVYNGRSCPDDTPLAPVLGRPFRPPSGWRRQLGAGG